MSISSTQQTKLSQNLTAGFTRCDTRSTDKTWPLATFVDGLTPRSISTLYLSSWETQWRRDLFNIFSPALFHFPLLCKCWWDSSNVKIYCLVRMTVALPLFVLCRVCITCALKCAIALQNIYYIFYAQLYFTLKARIYQTLRLKQQPHCHSECWRTF